MSRRSSPSSGLQSPRGTYDVLPEEAELRDRLVAAAGKLFEQAGYARIDTPIFESTELFARGVGDSTDIVRKEMYSFVDASERPLTLRPEGTAGVARSFIQHGMHKLPGPVKLWYCGPFFRFEKAQKGRQRQFSQLGAEVFGSDSPAVEAELIVLLSQILEVAGVDDAVLRLGSLGSADARAEYVQQLTAYLRIYESHLPEEVLARIDSNPLRAFDSADEVTQNIMKNAPRLLDQLQGDDAEHFSEVRALLDAAGVEYVVDPTLVRGLDYYNRTVFEFTSGSLGAQSGVGGGGRYDELVSQLGGPQTPAAGFGAGIERLLLAGNLKASQDVIKTLTVISSDTPEDRRKAFALATRIRVNTNMQVTLDLNGRSYNSQVKNALKNNATFIVVLEDDGTITLRCKDQPDHQFANATTFLTYLSDTSVC